MRRLYPIGVLCLALGLVWGFFEAAHAGWSADRPSVPEHLIEADSTGLTIELKASVPRLVPDVVGGRSCVRLESADFDVDSPASAPPGHPQLPMQVTLIGLPPVGIPSLEVLDSEAVELPGRYVLCPASDPALRIEFQQTGDPGSPDFNPQSSDPIRRSPAAASIWNAAAYARPGWTPVVPAELVEVGYFRSQRLGVVRFAPYRYSPESGKLAYWVRYRVRIDFGGRAAESIERIASESPLEAVLKHGLLNADQVHSWAAPARAAVAPSLFSADEDDVAAKIVVAGDGMVRLTCADLEAAGAATGAIDPHGFRLTNLGHEVPLAVAGEADGVCDPSDELLFYGQKLETRWTAEKVYWLSWGGASGLRIADMQGEPGSGLPIPTGFSQTLSIEHNLEYVAGRPSGPDDDRWYAPLMSAAASTPVTQTYTFSLPGAALDGGLFQLRGLLMGMGAVPWHHTRIQINHHPIAEFSWPATGEYSFEAAGAQTHLSAGLNLLEVVAPMPDGVAFESFYPNRFEIEYTRRYQAEAGQLAFEAPAGDWEIQVSGFSEPQVRVWEISDPRQPKRVGGIQMEPDEAVFRLRLGVHSTAPARYEAVQIGAESAPVRVELRFPSDLRSAENGADWLAIAHDDLAAAIQPLADFRESQGYRVKIVKLQDIYDEFGHGRVDPQAVREFLAYAYENWLPPAPSFVVLVGDGHFDPKNYKGLNDLRFIPPYLAEVDHIIGETAADNRFVAVSGADPLPDMALGRLPVRTPAETAGLAAKIIAYETQPAPGAWNRQVLLVADNADRAGNFADLSEKAAQSLPQAVQVDRVYYTATHATPQAANQAIVAAINDGRLLVSYVGHGAVRWWAAEVLFGRAHLPLLSNPGRLAVFLPMTCLDGYFIWPVGPGMDNSSLGEAVVLLPATGAVASFSPAGYGVAHGHDILERGFLEAVFTDGVDRIGLAAVQAKLYLYENSIGFDDLIETYTLFGDPATRLRSIYDGLEHTRLPLIWR